LLDGFLARGGLANHDDDVVGQLERRAKTLPCHGVVIDDERADRIHSVSLSLLAGTLVSQAYAGRRHRVGMEDDIQPQEAAIAAEVPAGPNEERVRQALMQVYDPELGINIVDLGLVYEIQVQDNGDVDIQYSLTTMGCPIGPMIEDQMRAFLAPIEGLGEVRPELVFRPAWSPEMMSEEAKAALGVF
jgi:metal-sulfur cluster biosynthetic enzyme